MCSMLDLCGYMNVCICESYAVYAGYGVLKPSSYVLRPLGVNCKVSSLVALGLCENCAAMQRFRRRVTDASMMPDIWFTD